MSNQSEDPRNDPDPERYYAEMASARITVEQAYFDARPDLDTQHNRDLFRAAFDRGFNKAWQL